MLAVLTVRGQQPTGLRVVVVQGQDAINVLPQGTAVSPVIEVRDANGDPVSGAFVQWTMRGRNARMNGGFGPVEMLADDAGRATVALTPVARGTVRVDVTATFLGAVATTTITQRNVMTEADATALAARRPANRGDADGDDLLPGARPEDRNGDASFLSIGLGAAAAAGGAFALSKLRGEPPIVPRVSITGLARIDGPVIRGVTELSFTVSGQKRSGELRWDFGDGDSATGQLVKHVYHATGSFSVTLTYEDEHFDIGTVEVLSLSGTWKTSPVAGLTHTLQIEQQDGNLGGTWTVEMDPGAPGNPTSLPMVHTSGVSGILTSPRFIELRQLGECERTAKGEVTIALNQINVGGFTTQPSCEFEEGWTFRRQ